MHLVTSSLFLSTYTATLKKASSKRAFLRSYLSTALAWWVSRGRPGFAISKFYEATGGSNADDVARAEIPGPKPTPNKGVLAPGGAAGLIPNPVLPIVQTTLTHPNDHLCKIQRSLAHASALYGLRPKGYFAHLQSAVEMGGVGNFEGVEKLDGSVFLRVARLTADRLGWMREGGEQHDWDRSGFY